MDEKTIKLAEGPNYAALSTLLADGTPQTHVMWVDTDGDHILVNTEKHRAKVANVKRDPRATITIIDAENPFRYAEVRGKVVESVDGPEAREHIDKLSRKYTGNDYGAEVQSERVILKISPDREVFH
ncbi:MAG: TIGR03618 family F420-dependent PPOX class oxidoreductase [Acidimicrobiia bacterium]|nr:TIGR03618 family F420-dependent PPOX class oxidoreductase [Acidimicrobiia bacterium]